MLIPPQNTTDSSELLTSWTREFTLEEDWVSMGLKSRLATLPSFFQELLWYGPARGHTASFYFQDDSICGVVDGVSIEPLGFVVVDDVSLRRFADEAKDVARPIALWVSASMLDAVAEPDVANNVGCMAILDGGGVTDLAIFSCFQNLEALAVESPGIEDFTPLSRLPALRALRIGGWGEPIRDFSPLNSLQSLESLQLSTNKQVDVANFSRLRGLKVLILGGVATEALCKLAEWFPNLQILGLEGTALSSLAMLGRMPNLRSLYVWDGRFSSLDDVSEQFPNLEHLDIFNERLSDISHLIGQRCLTSVDLRGCTSVTDVGRISKLRGLASLALPDEIDQVTFNKVIGGCDRLTELEVVSDRISSLSALASLKQLTSLVIRCVAVSDLEWLRELSALRRLDAAFDPQVSDFSVLSQAVSLEKLVLVHADDLTDLSWTSRLRNLKRLDLSNCAVSDLSPLCNLPQLTQLELTTCTKVQDLGPLSTLGSLVAVSLSDGTFAELWNGERNNRLLRLSVSGSAIETTQYLDTFGQLRELDLSWCGQLADVAELGACRNLCRLDLSLCSKLTDVSPLSHAERLRWLALVDCQALDITTLADVTQLTHLDIGSEALEDAPPVGRMKGLVSLNLEGCCFLEDISTLAPLSRLRHLSLSGCEAVADTSPLRALTSLKTLDLATTGVEDVAFVDSLVNLEWIGLENCEGIKDYAPLERFRQRGGEIEGDTTS